MEGMEARRTSGRYSEPNGTGVSRETENVGSFSERCQLEEGVRIGRFVVVRDIDGRWHAVAAGAVAAACEADDGSVVLMLPGGRLMTLPQPLPVVLSWLDGKL